VEQRSGERECGRKKNAEFHGENKKGGAWSVRG
jgi:hypothetical protein